MKYASKERKVMSEYVKGSLRNGVKTVSPTTSKSMPMIDAKKRKSAVLGALRKK